MEASDTGDSEKLQLLKYARRHFSPYVYFSEWDRSHSSAVMGMQIQEPILDNGDYGPTMRSILLKNVGAVSLDRKGKLKGPTRSEFAKSVIRQHSRLIDRSHSILLPTIYNRLVRVPEVSIAMAPFRRVIISLEELGELDINQFQKGMAKGKDITRYIRLLQDLSYVAQEGDKIYPGAKMKGLKAQNINPPELYEKILSTVMQERNKYLTEVLHLTMMVPYLRWSNTYYLPSYEAGRLIKLAREEFFSYYVWYYRKPEKQYIFIDQSQKVIDTGILKREDNLYVGLEDIFETYSKAADKEKLLQLV